MGFFSSIDIDYPFKLSDLPNKSLIDFKIPMLDMKTTRIDCGYTVDLASETYLFEKDIIFTRNFDIDIETSKLFNTLFEKNNTLNIGVENYRIANAGQVIGDIRFYDVVLNETNYDITLTPYGYGKWKEMITGDYIYTKALCKYSIQASLNANRPNTRQYLHKVDVPDIVDRGVVELTKENQPLFVRFSIEEVRKFHIVPELNVSIKSYSGTDKSPIIIPYNTTTEGFYVTMKADGEFVEGKISWSARGY